MTDKNSILIYGALVLAVVCWGFSFIATKIALQSLTPFCLIFIRFALASVFFAIMLLRRSPTPISRDSFKKLFLLALFQPVLYFFFETYGLKYTSATKTSLILGTVPVVVLVLSIIFLKERVRLITAVGILFSLTGVSLLIFGSGETAIHSSVIGDLLVVGAVLSAAVYMIFARHLGKTISPLQITGLQMILGTFLFLPFFLWDMHSVTWSAVAFEAIIAIVGLAVFATVGAFYCYNYALSHIEAARASVFINAIPIITAFGGWLILDESLAPLQMIGGAVVLGSVYLANYRT